MSKIGNVMKKLVGIFLLGNLLTACSSEPDITNQDFKNTLASKCEKGIIKDFAKFHNKKVQKIEVYAKALKIRESKRAFEIALPYTAVVEDNQTGKEEFLQAEYAYCKFTRSSTVLMNIASLQGLAIFEFDSKLKNPNVAKSATSATEVVTEMADNVNQP